MSRKAPIVLRSSCGIERAGTYRAKPQDVSGPEQAYDGELYIVRETVHREQRG